MIFLVLLISLSAAQFLNPGPLSIGDCYPPMPGGGSACVWNCGGGFYGAECRGVHYCSSKSTSCDINCLTELGCKDNLLVLSQSKATTTINCISHTPACKKLAVHCGDFDQTVISNLQRTGMTRLMDVLTSIAGLSTNYLIRMGQSPLQYFFTKKPGKYSKCALNCGGDGDTCSDAMLSCSGHFTQGCSVNALGVNPNSGESFKGGQFLCDLRHPKGHLASCLLNCPDNGNPEYHCREARYGCVASPKGLKPGHSNGKCYCQGRICTAFDKVFLGRVITAVPPQPTLQPTAYPTGSPTPKPTRRPTRQPTTGEPTMPTMPHTRKPTRSPVTRGYLHAFGRTIRRVGRVKKFTTKIDVSSMSVRRKFGGNQLLCKSTKCEIRCMAKGTCSGLIVTITKDVLQFKLSCESAQSCQGMELQSDATENKIECKGDKSCVDAKFGVDAAADRASGTATGKQVVELQCEGTACSGKKTQLSCGYNVSECKLQASGKGAKGGFKGVFNCFADNGNSKCTLECSGSALTPACNGAMFYCIEVANCVCENTGFGIYNDCPKIQAIPI